MACGKLTDERIAQLKRWAYMEIPLWKNFMLRYGFGGIAIFFAFSLKMQIISNNKHGLIIVLVLGALHLEFRKWFKRSLKTADLIGNHIIERTPLMRSLERDTEMHACGAVIYPTDWPSIVEEGFREVILAAYETPISKAFTFGGYGTLFWAGFFLK